MAVIWFPYRKQINKTSCLSPERFVKWENKQVFFLDILLLFHYASETDYSKIHMNKIFGASNLVRTLFLRLIIQKQLIPRESCKVRKHYFEKYLSIAGNYTWFFLCTWMDKE